MTFAETELHAHYVTMRITSRRAVVLAGPFRYRRHAERHVNDARRLAIAMSRGAHQRVDVALAGYGVARFTHKPGFERMAGRLNELLSLSVDRATGYIEVAEKPAATA